MFARIIDIDKSLDSDAPMAFERYQQEIASLFQIPGENPLQYNGDVAVFTEQQALGFGLTVPQGFNGEHLYYASFRFLPLAVGQSSVPSDMLSRLAERQKHVVEFVDPKPLGEKFHKLLRDLWKGKQPTTIFDYYNSCDVSARNEVDDLQRRILEARPSVMICHKPERVGIGVSRLYLEFIRSNFLAANLEEFEALCGGNQLNPKILRIALQEVLQFKIEDVAEQDLLAAWLGHLHLISLIRQDQGNFVYHRLFDTGLHRVTSAKEGVYEPDFDNLPIILKAYLHFANSFGDILTRDGTGALNVDANWGIDLYRDYQSIEELISKSLRKNLVQICKKYFAGWGKLTNEQIILELKNYPAIGSEVTQIEAKLEQLRSQYEQLWQVFTNNLREFESYSPGSTGDIYEWSGPSSDYFHSKIAAAGGNSPSSRVRKAREP